MGCRSEIAGHREDIVGRKIEIRRMGDEKSPTVRGSELCEAGHDLLIVMDDWCRETGQSRLRLQLGRSGLRKYVS